MPDHAHTPTPRFAHYPLARWWRLTSRAALRMVWGEFGWTHRSDRESVYFRKARVGYWVVLEQSFQTGYMPASDDSARRPPR